MTTRVNRPRYWLRIIRQKLSITERGSFKTQLIEWAIEKPEP